MIKLPSEVQLRICATSITTFTRATEELVYNSIDAKATSIAVRVHIKDSFIQVIDNGYGISKNNLKSIGQHHTTSKYNKSAVISIPEHYGFKGQALASLVKISQKVSITSRCQFSEDTWTKSFRKGKENDISTTNVRPSKGTTVEIEGFFYNLNIRKKSIDEFNELNKIKKLMEKLSLVHHNISFSLRDNSSNEIIFKVPKKRDIYQTLSSLYDVEKQDIRELQIEKKKYKVKAFITDKLNNYKWIYLNKKFVPNGRIKKIVDDKIKKYYHDNKENKSKLNHRNDEDIFVRNNELSYFIFIDCPYEEYDFSFTPKQSLIEFRNWEDITKILEKLIQFYFGELKVKEIHKNKPVTCNKKEEDTRQQVKNIIHRVLGSLSKKPKMSPKLNGVKGKFVKRTKKKRAKDAVFKTPLQRIDDNQIIIAETSKKCNLDDTVTSKPDSKIKHNRIKGVTKNSIILTKSPRIKINVKRKNIDQQNIRNDLFKHKVATKSGLSKLKPKENRGVVQNNIIISKSHKIIKKQKRKNIHKVTKKFQDENSFVKRRCNELAANVEKLLALHRKEEQNVKVNHIVQLSNIVKDNRLYTIKKHIEEITVETTKYKNNQYKSRYNEDDCVLGLRTVAEKSPLKKVLNTNLFENDKYDFKSSTEFQTYLSHRRSPKQTFESHEVNHYTGKNCPQKLYFDNNIRNFMTKESINNFNIYKSIQEQNLNLFKIRGKKTSNLTRKPNTKRYCFNQFTAIESSATITTFNSNMNTENVINTYELLGKNALDLHKHNVNTNALYYTLSPIRFCNKNTKENLFSNVFNTEYVNKNDDSLQMYENTELKYGNTLAVDMEMRDKYASISDKMHVDRKNENTYTLSTPFFSTDMKGSLECENVYPQELYNDYEKHKDDSQKSKLFFSTTYSVNINQAEKENVKSVAYFGDVKEDTIVSEDILPISSGYFELTQKNIAMESINELVCQLNNLDINKTYESSLNLDLIFDKTFNNEKSDERVTTNAFQFNDRNNLLPKGMSPICCNKPPFINLAESTHEKTGFVNAQFFNDFITNVQANMKIYEPHIKNVKELSTADVFNYKNRVNKDNDALIFDSESLKNATVLGQVDDKFIAAGIQGKCCQSNDKANYLVLFDQHAVHERIRLENILLDYLFEDQWNTVEIDSICLKLSHEELLYISNYSVKFKQFGLKWSLINDSEISVNGIPKAILGKNLRSVDKIIVALKKLILELVDFMRSQGLAFPLYPKSIMELVFSEACRYAIKFGERLSKEACVVLLRDLSSCKVPFQCAHGRPVMAVLLEIEPVSHAPYSLNQHNISKFKKNME